MGTHSSHQWPTEGDARVPLLSMTSWWQQARGADWRDTVQSSLLSDLRRTLTRIPCSRDRRAVGWRKDKKEDEKGQQGDGDGSYGILFLLITCMISSLPYCIDCGMLLRWCHRWGRDRWAVLRPTTCPHTNMAGFRWCTVAPRSRWWWEHRDTRRLP